VHLYNLFSLPYRKFLDFLESGTSGFVLTLHQRTSVTSEYFAAEYILWLRDSQI
jgi:hypothetical protein